METILRRRQHREQQALRLVREALDRRPLDAEEAEADAAAAPAAAPAVRGGRGARSLEALHAKVSAGI